MVIDGYLRQAGGYIRVRVFRALGGVVVVGVLEALELAEHLLADAVLGQHAADGHFEDGVGLPGEEILEGGLAVAPG